MKMGLGGLSWIVVGGIAAVSCGGGGASGPGGSGGAPNHTGGRSGDTGGSGSGGSTGTGGATAGTGGTTGSGGTGTGGGTGGGNTGGNAGSGTGGAGGALVGTGGRGGSGGAAGGATGTGGRGGGGGAAGTNGAGGAMGGRSGGGGATSCAGRALSVSANGTGMAADSAYAHAEMDLGTDLPIGNSHRTVEFWAFIKTTDWVGEKNEVYYYGGSANAGAFGLDFGTNPVMGMSGNHATLNPITGGGFNDDSTNDLGINSATDQWVHIAMTWNGTNVITYVNGLPKITTAGSGVTALATAASTVIIGCNPTNNSCFNGLFDELRIWNVARTATQIRDNYNKQVPTNDTGLVGYWKFDEMSGTTTTTADAVTTAGHTAHNGTLKANMALPSFVMPSTPLPLVCP